MYVDSMGNIGVTSDPQKVRPGMIYVDLSSRRDKKQIYEAYMNGAYLIFTPYNISDPELPVIKVNNPQDTINIVIDKFYRTQDRKAKIVAVFGESDKSTLLELIQCILCGRSDILSINGKRKNISFHRSRSNIEEFFNVFMDMHKAGVDIIPIGIDMNTSNLLNIGNMDIDCAILTDKGCMEGCDCCHGEVCYSKIFEKKVVILNNDEPYALKAVEGCKDVTVITYGLNKKASVTASSIDIGEDICFNFCVQRSFRTKKGRLVEPFEIPIRLKALGTHNIYNALAAITCGLYYDSDIERIKPVVESYKVPARHFQKVYDGEFTIIDNYCVSIYDYNAAFESIQILNYENLILIVSVSRGASLRFHGEKARLIAEWVKMLKCREVILTSCMDGDTRISELPIKTLRIYKKVFKENGIPFKYYHLLCNAIERGLSIVGRKDLFVMLGSDEMNMAQRLLHRQLLMDNACKN